VSDYAVFRADDVEDHYAGTSVPGEFRRLTDALGSEQLSVTLIRVPPALRFLSRAPATTTTRWRSSTS
jgi:hypothetical protein